ASVAHANLVGITGIARRLVLDGVLEETAAREAMAAATEARKPLAQYLVDNRLVAPVQMAAANSMEFGIPIFDVTAMDPGQTAIKLVSEELVRKHCALPLFKRGNRLYVGIADPTNTRALDEIKFHTNLQVESILVDEDRIRGAIDKWLETADTLSDMGEGDEDEDFENLDVSSGEDEDLNESGVDAKGDDTPVVKFVNKVLVDAIRR